MKGRGRLAALLAALCLLSGCGGEGEASLLGQAADMEETAVLLTVDGREVPAWRYLCWLAFTCGQVRERYEEAGLTLDWTTPVTGGTLGDYAKDQALADAALYATVENWAEDWGCTLTDAEREALPEPEAASLWCADEAQTRELAAVGALYGKLCECYQTGRSPLEPLPQAPVPQVDRILVSRDRENAQETVETLFAQLNGAEDQTAVFTELASAWDDPAGPRDLDASGWPASLTEAAQALEAGQISGILASDEGYSILRRLPDAAPRRTAGSQEEFDQRLQDAAEQAQVTLAPAYSRLDAAAFQQRLDQLQAESFSSR